MPQKVNYSDTTPSAPSGNMNVTWQADAPSSDPSVVRNISAYVPISSGGGGGSLFQHFADAGSVGTAETILYTDTIVGGTLAANGYGLIAKYGGTLVTSTSTKEVRIYFGGIALFDSAALTITGASAFDIEVMIVRENSTTFRYSVRASITGSSGVGQFANYARITGTDLTLNQVLKITGQAGGTGPANNDIVASVGEVWLVATSGGGGLGTGAVSFVTAVSPATINLSTQGTIDWFTMNAALQNPPRGVALGNVHSKQLGGWIKDSFDWINGGTGTPSLAAGGATGVALTTTAGDDTAQALSAATPVMPLIRCATGTPLNFGYRFRVPAGPSSKTLRLNIGINSVKVTITCAMLDGSVANQSTTLDAVTSGTYIQKEIAITFNAGSYNSEMMVTVEVTTNYGGSFQDVGFITATIG